MRTMREMSLEFFAFPGCIVAANTLRHVRGDYETVAHIAYSGVVRFFAPDLRPEYIASINAVAARELDSFRQRYLASASASDESRRRLVTELCDRIPLAELCSGDRIPLTELCSDEYSRLYSLPPEQLYDRFMQVEMAAFRGQLPSA